MTLRIPAKVLIHVWSYDFYDMTLSTGKQRRHMTIRNIYRKPSEQLFTNRRSLNYRNLLKVLTALKFNTKTQKITILGYVV